VKTAGVFAAVFAVCSVCLAQNGANKGASYADALTDLARFWNQSESQIEGAALAEATAVAGGQNQPPGLLATNRVLSAGGQYTSLRAHLERDALMSREEAEDFLVAGRVLPEIGGEDFAKIFASGQPMRNRPPNGSLFAGLDLAVYAAYFEKFKDDPVYLLGCFKRTQDTQFLNKLLQNAVKATAKRLRKEGKSIVTTGGVNPLAVEMKPLLDACNGPMLVGVESAYQVVTGDAGAVVSMGDWHAKQAVFQKTYEDVNDGTVIKPTMRDLQSIRFLLGTHAYNSWAKSYNTGNAK